MSGVVTFMIGFVVSVSGATLIIRIPGFRRLGSVVPTEDRWHRQVTPGLGGIPMFIAFAVSAWLGGAVHDAHAMAIITGASLLFIVGVLDDLHGLSAGLKFLAQLSVACFVSVNGFLSVSLSEVPWFYALPGIVWMVMMANGINLLDNMDGLAGGVSLIASIAILMVLTSVGDEFQSIRAMLTGLNGALAGFLVLNIYPAKLFMGDSGSQWLGLVIGASSLFTLASTAGSTTSPHWVWLVPILILSVPLIDTSFVMVTRRLRGQAVTQGGRDHLSHRLVSLGFSDRRSVAILWLLSAGGAIVALGIVEADMPVWSTMLAAYIICVFALVRRVLSATITTEGSP